jgi:glutamate dehydrogenase/leucine dehydrogenase
MIIMKKTINEVCTKLKEIADYKDDIFLLSFRADGKSEAYKVLNKGDGIEAQKIDDFKELKNIVFTDTVNQEETDIIEYMKKHKYNKKNGDGEMIIAFEGRTKTMNMLALHNSVTGPPLGGLRQKDYSTFDSMLTDTLRLAKGMAYKAAVAQTGTGGGKSTRTVPKGIRKEANLGTARMLNFVNKMRKKRGVDIYYVAEDSNTVSGDFDEMDDICATAAL